jgi:hypothetical protein
MDRVPEWASQPGVTVGLPDLPDSLQHLPVGPLPMSAINVPDDQLLDQDIKRAIDAQLATKGLTKVDKGGDILVGYQAHIREEKGINLYGSGADGFWGGGPYSGGRPQLGPGPDLYHSHTDAGSGPV